LLSCKPNSSIKVVAAILIGETSYLIAWGAAVCEIDLQLYAIVGSSSIIIILSMFVP
jgi:hypothetical protein